MSDGITPFAFTDTPRWREEVARLNARRDLVREHLHEMQRRYYLRFGGFLPSFREAILLEAMNDAISYTDSKGGTS